MWLIWLTGILIAQSPEHWEGYIDEVSEENGQVGFLQLLSELQSRPLAINRARIRDLLQIPFLSLEMAGRIVNHRRREGAFEHPDALLAVPGMTTELQAAILPYIRFTTHTPEPLLNYRVQVTRDLHQLRGYLDGIYQNPLQLLQQVRWHPSEHLSGALQWEKDAGEQSWMDFTSFYLKRQFARRRVEVLLGDFTLAQGHQLVVGDSYGSPLSLDNFQAFRREISIYKPKRSTEENRFLRGVVCRLEPDNQTAIHLAVSRRSHDAGFSKDSLTINSLGSSGYHRTENELARQDQLSERAALLSVVRNFRALHAGVQWAAFEYGAPVQLEQGSLTGTTRYASVFYRLQKDLLTSAGEVALLDDRYPAIQQSIFWNTGRRPYLKYGVLYYYYHPEYTSLHGRAFGEAAGRPQNEQGILLSSSFSLNPGLKAAVFFHSERPVEPLSEFPFVSKTLQAQLAANRSKYSGYLRYSRRERKRHGGIGILPKGIVHILRLQLEASPSDAVRFRQRMECSRAGEIGATLPPLHGWAFYQDIRFRRGTAFVLQARWTHFDVPGYDYRLYEFEPDVPGAFRNSLLHGRGYKWFFLLRLRTAGRWHIAVKYHDLWYPDAQTLGSGLDQVSGNRKRELRLQFEASY